MTSRIGSLVFCVDCGNLLDVPGGEDHLACDQCGRMESAKCSWPAQRGHWWGWSPEPGLVQQHSPPLRIFCDRDMFRDQVAEPHLQEGVVIVTRSHPSAFPSSLRQKRSLVQPPTSAKDLDPAQAAPLMDETCPKCQNPQMKYHTLQLRSADEGTTVFYECPKCGHKFSTNN